MKGWWTIVFLSLSAWLWAQDATFYAEVDKNAVAKDGVIRLDVVIENGDMQSYEAPAFTDFDVLRTSQGQSTNITIRGNQQVMVRRITRSYLIRPRKTGQLTIEPAKVRIEGQLLETEPITITVTGSGTNPSPTPSPNNLPKKNIFVRAVVNKTSAYVGEQVLLSYKLYTRQNIASYNEPTTTYAGFWKEDIAIKNPSVKREVINGIAYRTAIVKQVILFPQQSGKLDIPAADMTVDVEYNFFSTRRIELKTNALSLEIQPLPNNAPASFTGAVGDLSLNTTISGDSAAVDEPITLRMTLKGRTNFDLLGDPVLTLPNGFEVYDPKVSANTSKSGGVLRGSKTYEYLIIPRQPGTYKLDPISISYFDPTAEAYQTLNTPEYTFTITGDGAQGGGNVIGINKEDIELLGEDIRYIKSEADWTSGSGSILGTPLFWTLSVGPLATWIILFVFVRWRNNREVDPLAQKQKKALAAAQKQLRLAEKARKEGDNKGFFDHVRLALWHYARDRFVIPQHELNKDTITTALQRHEIDVNTIERYHQVLDTCDMALYAPIGGSEAKDQLVADAKQIMQDIQTAAKS